VGKIGRRLVLSGGFSCARGSGPRRDQDRTAASALTFIGNGACAHRPGQASATLCSTHATPWTPCRVDDPACSGMVAPSASTDTAGYPDGQTLALLQDRQAGAVSRLVGPGIDHEGPHPAARSGPPTTCVLRESPGARPNASGSHQLLAAAEHDQQLRRRRACNHPMVVNIHIL
jgi:hypothetical protein